MTAASGGGGASRPTRPLGVVLAFGLLSCGADEGVKECGRVAGCASTCDDEPPTVLHDATDAVKATQVGVVPVQIALTLFTAWSADRRPPDAARVGGWVEASVSDTRAALAPCGVSVEVLRAELVAVAADRLDVVANPADSKLAAFRDAGPPEALLYEAGERLSEPARALLAFSRRDLPDTALGVAVVDAIRVREPGGTGRAGALAFPPTVYHHPDDFPERNGVLVSAGYASCGDVPSSPAPRVLAHELGHMLLDVAHHDDDPVNLMSTALGPELRADQCDRLVDMVSRLGRPDPGPP